MFVGLSLCLQYYQKTTGRIFIKLGRKVEPWLNKQQHHFRADRITGLMHALFLTIGKCIGQGLRYPSSLLIVFVVETIIQITL